ncbi:MAG: hemolysin family protein [bacterium]|nr:hemolysin family protein [bacterium]
MDNWLNLIFLCLLLVFSAFNFAAEISIIALGKVRLKALVEKGQHKAKIISKVFAHPERLFGTILIVNNLVTILAGSIGTILALNLFGDIAIIPATIIVTIFITMGDVIAKTYAAKNPEQASFLTIRPLRIIMVIFYPVVKFFAFVTNLIIKILGGGKDLSPFVTREELQMLVKIGHEEGVLEEKERELLHRIFEFSQKKAKEIMIKIDKMVACDLDSPIEEIMDRIIDSGHRRIPVFKNDVHNIIGIAYTKDLLAMARNVELLILEDCLSKPHFIAENMRVIDLLSEFQKSKVHLAIVRDGNDKVVGLVAIDDLFAEIVGEIIPEHHTMPG